MNEDELRLLIERTHLVEQATATTGWELLKDRAFHTIADHQKRVLGGAITDLSDYKKLTGWIEGATFVLTLPERMQKELDDARIRNAEGGDAA